MYVVESVPEIGDQLSALPPQALTGYAEVSVVLQVAPWGGDPYKREKPDANMRTMVFGDGGGLITYVILEDQRRVVVIQLIWWD